MTSESPLPSYDLKSLGIGLVLGLLGASTAFFLRRKFSPPKKPLPTIATLASKHSTLTSTEQSLLDTEQLIRLQQFFGSQKLAVIRSSKVIVFGLGGVGSHMVNMLIRSGVTHLKIVDFDRVSLSSLSRHAYAVRQDVGTPKTECMKKYIHKIFPRTIVQTVEQYVSKQNVERLLEDQCDYVVDCIDNIDAKVELAVTCVRRGIKLVVSGGAGMKNDATQIQIRDIADARNDELISSLRRRLNKIGIRKGITCVFSRQQATKQLLPLNQAQEQDPDKYRVFQNYRVRIVPVLGTMPALIGQAIASYVLCRLCDQPYQPYQADDIKTTHYLKIFNRVVSDQGKLGTKQDDLQFDIEDIYILMRYVYKWKCIVTNKEAKQYYLTRYEQGQKANGENLVPMCKEAYDRHIKGESAGEMGYDEGVRERYERGREEVRRIKAKRGFVVVREK